MEFQIVSINAEDDDESYKIHLFGKTKESKSVHCVTEWNPYFYVETDLHPSALEQKLKYVIGKDISEQVLEVIKETKKKFYGFTNSEYFNFLKIKFLTKKAFTRSKFIFQQGRIKLNGLQFKPKIYEANIEPFLRFFHVQNIETAGWVSVSKYSECEDFYNVDINIDSKWNYIIPLENPDIAPIVLASFDIEVYSHDGAFPDPEIDEDYVTQICTTFQRYGDSEPYKVSLLCLRSCDSIENCELQCFDTEKQVLEAWSELIRGEGSDVLIGYNIWGFDLNYMYTRAKMCSASGFFYFDKITKPVQFKNSSFSSGAYGDSDYKMVPTQGILQIDLLVIIKREHKLSSYKLDDVAEHFLKERKVALKPKEMFAKFNGTSSDRKDVGIYCIQDTMLPLRLVNKLAIIPNMFEMAKVTRVPLGFLLERGQSVKVQSQVLFETLQDNMLVETFDRSEQTIEQGYEGATVLNAKKGAYVEVPITGLDFASLYPTIMIANNLCPSTLIIDEKYKTDDLNYVVQDGFYFVQNEKGITARMLEKLAKNRKAAKKKMAAAKDAFEKAVYNGKQLAFKVSMNSIYGFYGASVGAIPCKPVAACTTSIGRGMIDKTANLVMKWYPGSDVVYGDSVTGDTPILIKNANTNKIFIQNIENITSFGNCIREYVDIHNLQTYTASGWIPINRVMRHKCTKNIYKIITKTGIVDVTEDHSLLNEHQKEMKPTELKKGQSLLSVYPFTGNCNYTKKTFANSKLQAAEIFLKYKKLYSNVYVEFISDDKYVIYSTNDYVDSKVIKIINLGETEQWVYDLTTDDHHFQAGIGSLIVHNTDSVMVQFKTDKKGKEAIEECFKLGEEAAERISATFKKPIELEFEKVYFPYLLFSKKRYAGLMYTNPEKPDYIDAKGIQLVRRDNCMFVRKVSKAILNEIMYNLSVEQALDLAKNEARKLLANEVPVEDLVVSKSLKRISYSYDGGEVKMTHDYKNANQPHLFVAKNLEQREIGSGPRSGDRVPYVFIDTGRKSDLQYMKAEDPTYVRENNIQIDSMYYIEHAMMNPLESLFEVLIDNPKKEIFDPVIQEHYDNQQYDLIEYINKFY